MLCFIGLMGEKSMINAGVTSNLEKPVLPHYAFLAEPSEAQPVLLLMGVE